MSAVADRVEHRQRRVASAVAVIATYQVGMGASRDLVLNRLALGADAVRDMVDVLGGPDVSPNTIRADLVDIFGAPTGQLKTWTDPQTGQPRKGAYTYRITNMRRTLGRFGRQRLKSVARSLTTCTSYLNFRSGRRIDGALRWAKQHAIGGQRNEIGRWLAWRCIELRLTDAETLSVMTDYHHSAAQVGHSHPYRWREVVATMRCAPRAYARRYGRRIG